MAAATRVPAQHIRQQLVSVLRAWGMSETHADTTAEMMLETDLRGVDSHGISMLPTYDKEFRSGRLNMRPAYKTLRDGPAMLRKLSFSVPAIHAPGPIVLRGAKLNAAALTALNGLKMEDFGTTTLHLPNGTGGTTSFRVKDQYGPAH